MSILRCRYNGVDVHIRITSPKMLSRIQNAARLEDMKIADWDAMTKTDRLKLRRDYDWFMKLVTKEKIKGRHLALGALQGRVGVMRGNSEK